MKHQKSLGPDTAKHSYDVEINVPAGQVQVYTTIPVQANNRAQAARIAEKAGYTVRSVNLIG